MNSLKTPPQKKYASRKNGSPTLCIAYPNKFAYSETFIEAHVDYLRPEYFIYHGWYPTFQHEGKPLLPFPFGFTILRGIIKKVSPKFFHKIFTKALRLYLQKHSIEVVLAEYGPTGVSIMDACEIASVPFVVFFHGFDAYQYATLEKYKFEYQRLFNKANAIIAGCLDMKEHLICLGADPKKVFCCPGSGVDPNKFYGATPASSDPIFVAVGRFVPKKAPHLTLQAFSKVVSLCPEAKLIMIGNGELLESSKKLAVELHIEHSVEFQGAQPSENVANTLRKARAFVQHSMRAPDGDSEGTAITPIEASATGLPVISTLHAGIKESILHNETGFLVQEGDVEGMAQYMIRLAKNSSLAAHMGAKGREFIKKKFSMEISIQCLRDVIASVVEFQPEKK